MPLTSYYTALTGLNTNSFAINVIGDNLANMNTTAFKSGQAYFQELLAGISGTDSAGNPISTGLGSAINGIAHNNGQGTVTYTGNTTDAAINGSGYFVVNTENEMGYTRSGSFKFDKDGNFISADGFAVMGYMGVDGVIDTNADITNITIKKGQLIPASATNNISMFANLDSGSDVDTVFRASIGIFDSIGTQYELKIDFTKTGNGQWSWSATMPAEAMGGAAGDPPVEVGSGDLEFDGVGLLSAPTTNPTFTIGGLTSGADDIDVTFNLLDPSGNPMITSYARESAVASTTQDGFAASAVNKISIDNSGVIMGVTDSGQSISLAQLVLANFPNVEGMQKYKGSTFIPFSSSGEPSIGVANSGGRGSIVGSSLEQSNVDMAQEFVNLIRAQRAYQANSRIISTTDELNQDTLNLKR
jgi:flagellar hook protein FlgE